MRAPREPTAEEREEHELTHLPYRAWCKHCVRGRGKSEAHKELHAEAQHTVPHVSMDYCFMGQDESKCLPILVVRDHASRFTFSQVVPCKGTGHLYCAKQLVANLEVLGHSRLLIKCDQENSIMDLRSVAIAECKKGGIDVLKEESPTGESQSNSMVERAVQDVEGLVRVLKDQVEHNYNLVLDSKHPVLAWLVNHAGFLLSRFQLSADGLTSYERLKGKPFRRKLFNFAECVHYMPIGKNFGQRKHLNKLDARWRDGVFLGCKETTNEYFIGTPSGVVRAFSIQRKILAEQHNDVQLLSVQ